MRFLIVTMLLVSLLSFAARAEEEAFQFVVLADTHVSTEFVQNGAVFGRLVKEIESLQPAFAVFVGDNVDGHVADAEALDRNWKVFDDIAGQLTCPYHLVVGNNDVHSPASADLWRKRRGDPVFSFRHGNAVFVCLDGETPGAKGRFASKDLDLVKDAVAGAKEGELLFVFTHQPWWRTPAPRSNWMTDVHPVLAKHPSAHVFAGHWHHYEQGNTRDGVQYTVLGPSGGNVGKVEIGGRFHNFLLVTVKGPDVKVQVVREGKMLPADVVKEDLCTLLFDMERSLTAQPVELTGETTHSVTREVSLQNTLDEALDLTLEIVLPEGCHWSVEGAERTLTIDAEGRGAVAFPLVLDGAALPLPKIHAVAHAGGKLVLDREISWAAKFDRRLVASRVEEPPTIDAVLDEAAWKKAAAAAPFVSIGGNGNGYAKRGTKLRALWTPDHLYVALECAEPAMDQLHTRVTQRDWSNLTDDAVLLFLNGEAEGPTYCLGANAAGVPMEFKMTAGRPDLAWRGPWEVAAKKGETAWTLEMAIPWSMVGFKPETDECFRFAVFRHAVPGGRELSGWTLPKGGSLANPEGFGRMVLE